MTYLCFKLLEKLAYKFLHCKHDLEQEQEQEQEHAQQLVAVAEPSVDLVAFKKIR